MSGDGCIAHGDAFSLDFGDSMEVGLGGQCKREHTLMLYQH